MGNSSKQVALVTGASKGIGRYIARALARRGMRLALVARSRTELESLCAELRTSGAEAMPLTADVSVHSGLARLVREVEGQLGPIDVLVNNAGVMPEADYVELAPSAIARDIAINLMAPMLLTQLVLPGMIARGRGHIVNIASIAGLVGTPYNETYATTKHGLVGFTRALRGTMTAEGHPIGATVICPGFIDDAGMYHDLAGATGIAAPPAFGTSAPSDVAQAVLRALAENPAEIIVNRKAVKPVLVAQVLRPSWAEWLAKKTGGLAFWREAARARRAAAAGLPAQRGGSRPQPAIAHALGSQ